MLNVDLGGIYRSGSRLWMLEDFEMVIWLVVMAPLLSWLCLLYVENFMPMTVRID